MVLMVFKTRDRGEALGSGFADGAVVASLEHALRFSSAVKPRAIVLDVYAGGNFGGRDADGLRHGRAVDAIPELARVAPVVFVTDNMREMVIAQALALGACGVVYRYDEDFAARVNDFVAAERARREASSARARRRAVH